MFWTIGALAAAILLVGTVWLFLLYPSTQGPSQGREVELAVTGEESATELAGKLADAGLLTSPRTFALFVRLSGGTSRIVKGTHLLTDDATPRELLARLERGTGAGHVKVTFPEGWTRFDMAKRLQEKHVCPLRAFLDRTTDAALLAELRIDGDSAEGFLFPATYDVAYDSDPADLVRRMKSEFDRRYALLENRHGPALLDLGQSLKFGMREIVTLASMIEKEAAVDDERPVIASVFLNRLRDPDFRPKLLQSDPTAGYGCIVAPERAPSCAGYQGKITPAMNHDAANPYSTYVHEGLPPGPIANPGVKSLEAVMTPAMTHFFYFVAKGEGRHTFSETYTAHNAAIHDKK